MKLERSGTDILIDFGKWETSLKSVTGGFLLPSSLVYLIIGLFTSECSCCRLNPFSVS